MTQAGRAQKDDTLTSADGRTIIGKVIQVGPGKDDYWVEVLKPDRKTPTRIINFPHWKKRHKWQLVHPGLQPKKTKR